MERKEITLMLNADEAEFLQQALSARADKFMDRISFVEELERYVGSTLQMAFDPAFADDADYDDSMDGDHDSAMASAGFGTDEDYGYYGDA